MSTISFDGALRTSPPLKHLQRNSAERYCNKKAAPITEGGDLVRRWPWLCACLASLGQFNWKALHATGQCYWDASHRCSVVVSGIHFSPGGNHIDRSDGEQRGSDDYRGYVGHGLVPYGSRCPSIPLV